MRRGPAASLRRLLAARAWIVLLAVAVAGCGVTIREEASRAGDRPESLLPASAAARLLDREWRGLRRGKRIFDIRLTDRVRVLNGEGALVYETEPLRLRLDVFGPHATPVLSLIQLGDSLALELVEERRLVAGRVGDPAFAELVEGRAFTGHELLGALLGAYDVGALVTGDADTVAYATDGELRVVVLERARAHRFTYAAQDSTLREYRQDRGGRAAYRVRFSRYTSVEGRSRPFRVEVEDVAERRTVRVDVTRETFDPEVPEDAYRLDPY